MKKPNRFTVYTTDPKGAKSVEYTTYLNTTHYQYLEGKGYTVQIWEDTRYKARERLYRLWLYHNDRDKYIKKYFTGVYSGYDGPILTF